MPKLITWNLSCLRTKSRPLTGPLPDLYIRDITRMVEELQGVYLSGIQVADPRRFAIPNPRFKDFPLLYNPVVIDQYDLVKSEGEGCLSFPGLWVLVPRFKFVTISYRDGAWKEVRATFGDDDPESEAGLLAKAVQHEIFHMNGVVIHDRMKDPSKRLKVAAKITNASVAQNKTKGAPKLVNGPAECDPPILPVLPTSESTESIHTEGDAQDSPSIIQVPSGIE